MIRTNIIIFLALSGAFLVPLPASGEHIPWSILDEIEREANEPACRYENRLSGTTYDCTDVDPEWVDCFTVLIHDDLTYQEALDLLGQLKVSNTYYEAYYAIDPNSYIDKDYVDLLDEVSFICEF